MFRATNPGYTNIIFGNWYLGEATQSDDATELARVAVARGIVTEISPLH